jgi:hypothetical protein
MTVVLASPLPDRHRPVEKCALCDQPWPCLDEQARVRAVQAAREARERGLDAALVLKQVTDGSGS